MSNQMKFHYYHCLYTIYGGDRIQEITIVFFSVSSEAI
jgi:hypothetical protein